MSKLLSANVIRLKKDKVFWIGVVFMIAAGIFLPVMGYMDAQGSGYTVTIDSTFFACSVLIGIVSSVFCSFFMGTEYSDGTIRNKVVIGHKRTSIYIANFITATTVSVGLCALYFVVCLCVGIPLLGFFVMEMKIVLLFTLTVLMLAVVFSSIFTLVSMLNSSKAAVAILCVLLTFGLLFAGSILNRMLEAPEIIPTYTMSDDGNPVAEEVPNPKYLEGAKRKHVQNLYDILPADR